MKDLRRVATGSCHSDSGGYNEVLIKQWQREWREEDEPEDWHRGRINLMQAKRKKVQRRKKSQEALRF